MEYPKIQTLFKRDEHSIIIPNEFTLEEFDYLKNNLWECTEKIDGMNMRIEISMYNNSYSVKYQGRTERAKIPTHMQQKMEELFNNVNWSKIFPHREEVVTNITIYGEGYGMKIQTGGNYIPDGVNFILFDIKVGNWWLKRDQLEDVARRLNIDIVPLIGYMTIPEAIEYAKKGFKSTIAYNKDYDAEGLVLKPQVPLMTRGGDRLITKIKTNDFRKYIARYGDNPAEQKINPHYENYSE